MKSVDKLLGQLERVKRTGAGRWLACCPAHADKGPSLSLRETDDGRVLVYCFAGCSSVDILAAVGLELRDLYPEPLAVHHKPERRPFPAVDVLRCIAFEALVVSAAAAALLAGEPFGPAERERLILAAGRIQSALTAAGVNYG